MKIYNETKTELLTTYDLTKGYLKEDKIVIHHAAVKERKGQYHYKTIKEYPNGGKDVEEICDVEPIEAKESYDEELNVYVYIPYTETELKRIENENRIFELKIELEKVMEDIEQEQLGIVRDDYAVKRQHAGGIINELRVLEGKEPRDIINK